MNSIIICGPQASGKTVNAEALCKHFGLGDIRDDWRVGDPFQLNGTLHLTNDPSMLVIDYVRKNDAREVRVVPIETALAEADLPRPYPECKRADGTAVVDVPRTEPGYEKLREVLDRAFEQASAGKGKERHANGKAFEDQPMQTIAQTIGSIDGMIYQAHKKSSEALNLPAGRDVAELLGAIVYLAGAVIARESWNKR